MRRWPRLPIVLVLVVAGACTRGSGPAPTPSASRGQSFARGGTLRAAFAIGGFLPDTFDPQRAYNYGTWEIFRCCLTRTLLSYNGHPSDEGGAEVRPDLAVSMPTVSTDGLTWTFHMRRGIHYGPPFEDRK